MIAIRRSEERGKTIIDWLDSRHTFSFNQYYDPRFMGFRSLRVINDDKVAPGSGFGRHPHKDMEIITYVLSGELAHKDSLGNGSSIKPGEVQRMSAGTGITHSEFNNSPQEPVHLYQIWIEPAHRSRTPSYEQKNFPPAELQGQLRLVAAADGRDGAVTIDQDAELYVARLRQGNEVAYQPRAGRNIWVQAARGEVILNGELLAAGDGAAITGEEQLTLAARSEAEVLLFDLA